MQGIQPDRPLGIESGTFQTNVTAALAANEVRQLLRSWRILFCLIPLLTCSILIRTIRIAMVSKPDSAPADLNAVIEHRVQGVGYRVQIVGYLVQVITSF